MKERPILFNDAMVRAILAGAKTQTRRVVQPQPVVSPQLVSAADDDDDDDVCFMEAGELRRRARWGSRREPCPYGAPGDRLWVRETHYRFGHWEPVAGKATKGGRQKWAFVADSDAVRFDRPEGTRGGRRHADPSTPAWHVRLARFMPRWASRLTLEVTSVRVERVQSISEDDALAEGAEPVLVPPDGGSRPHVEGFAGLWDSINGEREGCSWSANPWVWVVGFKRLEVRRG